MNLVARSLTISRIFVVILSAIFVSPLGCASDEEKLADFMKRGGEYKEAGQLEEAIIEYRNVLQIDPNSVEAHRELADAYLESEKLKEGYWELSETVRLDPDDVESRIAYATISIAAQNFELALEQADAIVELAPDDAKGHLIRAGALGALDRLDEVEPELILAIELDPDEVNYRIALAAHYAQAEDLERAEAQLNEAIAQEDGPVVRNHLANVLMAQERYDEVESTLQQALVLAGEPTEEGDQHPNLAGAYVNLSLFFFTRERNDEGTAILEQGIERVAEGKRKISDVLLRHYRSVGDSENAKRVLEMSTAFDTSDPEPWLAVSNARGRVGDLEGALEAAEKAVLADPTSNLATLRKAELLIDIGLRGDDDEQVAEAVALVAAVAAKDPSSAEAAFVRGKLEIAMGNPKEAVEALRDAIAGKPDWAQAHFVLGSALLMTRDLHRSRAELARAVELNAGLLPARKLLAQVHAELGEHEYAIQNGRRYLARKPEDDATRILMAQSMVRLAMFDEAAEILEEIPEDRRNVEALFAIGRVSMARGNVREAREAFALANAERPHDPNILNSLLALHDAEGQVEAGIELIDQALQANPESADLWHVFGLGGVRIRDFDGAITAFEKAIELEPGRVESYNQLARLYAAGGKLDMALKQYVQASETNPENASIRHFLGVMYEMTGDSKKASEQYELALQIDGNLAETKNNLAYMMAEEDRDLDRALKLSQEAKAALPDSASAADTLGWVLYKRGVHSAAIGYLREAVNVAGSEDSAIGEIRMHLSRAYEASGDQSKALESLQAALTDIDGLRKSGKLGKDDPAPPWADRVRSEIERLQAAG